jgi:hypothetical protein
MSPARVPFLRERVHSKTVTRVPGTDRCARELFD